MTVCIAAVCDLGEKDGTKIVCCSDMLMSGALGKAESRLKQRFLVDTWSVLIAGEDGEMGAVLYLLKDAFQAKSREEKMRWDVGVALSLVRKALADRKEEKANELIQSQYAMTYRELLEFGAAKLPPEIYREAMWSVRDCKIDAEFLVTGFTHYGTPVLIQTSSDGRAHLREDFAVIGAGGYLAQSVMMHREQTDTHTLNDTVYFVFEAKKYAEGETSVGKQTTVTVHYQNGTARLLRGAGKTKLIGLYATYGPQPVPSSTISLPPDEEWLPLRGWKREES